ncbi:MAG TPA: hypothetical protein VGM47_06945 [Gammaproteobacteria bacterium]|jgi:hypothetical protein
MKTQAKLPTRSDDDELDAALAGTFPASDPVSPHSHVEEEMERRRRALEQDSKDATEDALDEALEETFPASDSIAVHHTDTRQMPNPDDKDEHKERRSVRRKRPAGKKNKTAKKKPARSKKLAAKKKVAKKKTMRRITNKKKRNR